MKNGGAVYSPSSRFKYCSKNRYATGWKVQIWQPFSISYPWGEVSLFHAPPIFSSSVKITMLSSGWFSAQIKALIRLTGPLPINAIDFEIATVFLGFKHTEFMILISIYSLLFLTESQIYDECHQLFFQKVHKYPDQKPLLN